MRRRRGARGRARPWAGVLGAIALAMAACGAGERAPDRAEQALSAEGVSRTTEIGPVRATVTLAPEAPTLGDPITLTLEVESEPGVEIGMPAFGEALGRFQIVQYVPREQVRADGERVASQTYTLQAPMSGRQRIPPLRVEFVDRRDGQKSGQAQAQGSAQQDDTAGDASGQTTDHAAAAPEVQELLTEELSVVVGSVLPEGAVAEELRPARGTLPLPSTSRLYLYLGLGALALLGAGGFLGLRAWRRAARRRVRISAYDVAVTRLRELEDRGLPGAGEADAWYVELSAIVRRYLEDRYGLRAPELTTEEFLREARRSGQLSSKHRTLLSDFLSRCDRVKFARYEPGDDESRQALASARDFLEETRLMAREQASQAG